LKRKNPGAITDHLAALLSVVGEGSALLDLLGAVDTPGLRDDDMT
jgi:hypothetical protein